MPFVQRVTETPPLNRLLELEQIVLVDKTGPTIPLGPSQGAVGLVAEFLKGPFIPREVVSTGDFLSTYGGVSNLLSQNLTGLQDGSGVRYEGNGAVGLVGKRFTRLVIQRVNTDMTTTDGGAALAFVKFKINVATSDQDPLDATKTGKDLIIPAGTRFADAPLGTETAIVALSQDVIIPKGATITTGQVTVGVTLTQNADGLLTRGTTTTGLGATAFFVKGTTLIAGALDTPIDTALPGVSSTISVTVGDTLTVNAADAATAIFAAGTAALALDAKIESLYAAAIEKTKPVNFPAEDVNVIWAGRRGATAAVIRTPVAQNAIDASSDGRGRISVVSGPRVGTAVGDSATATAAKTDVMNTTAPESPGRSDRKIVCFPYVKVFSSDLQKLVVVSPDGFMASTLSNFPEEKNPGARNAFIQSIQEFEDAFIASPLVRQDYVNFKSKGVATLRKDRAVGWWFQSGITSVDPAVDQTRAPIKRRRMADFIQDTLASIGARYNKEPATTERVDQMVGEIEAFLTALKSPPNPSQQRIEDFLVDAVSGNTPKLTALGIFTVIVKVRTLASMDTLVFETTIGETVEIQAQAA